MAKPGSYDKDKLKAVFANLREAFSKLGVDAYEEVGEYVAKRIVSKARQGKQVVGDEEKNFEPLSPNYINFRRKLAAGNVAGRHQKPNAKNPMQPDSQFFSPARANNTLTGQFLDSIEVTETDTTKGLIVIAASEEERIGSTLTNDKLSGYLKKMGRSIFAIDATARKVILNMLKRRVRAKILKK